MDTSNFEQYVANGALLLVGFLIAPSVFGCRWYIARSRRKASAFPYLAATACCVICVTISLALVGVALFNGNTIPYRAVVNASIVCVALLVLHEILLAVWELVSGRFHGQMIEAIAWLRKSYTPKELVIGAIAGLAAQLVVIGVVVWIFSQVHAATQSISTSLVILLPGFPLLILAPTIAWRCLTKLLR